jgi:hypothetical protein
LKRYFKSLILIFFLFWLVTFFQTPVWADPSASDLLNTAKAKTTVNCNTQHLLYSTTSVIQKPNQAPITMTQTTELFKQSPNLIKIITNNGTQQSVAISVGDGYLYVQNQNTGAFEPIKSPFPINPFQDLQNQLSDFDQATANNMGDHYEVTLHGGKLPKNFDHATVNVDAKTNVVTHMEGVDVNGNKVLSVDASYQKIGNTYHPQHVHTESHTTNFDVSADMNVITNDVNQGIPVSVFAIK